VTAPTTVREMSSEIPGASTATQAATEPAPVRAAAVALLGIQTATLLLLAATVATRVWQDHTWFGLIALGVAAAVWLPELRRRRARRWWFAYVGGIFAYTLLRAYADQTTIPVRTMYVIQVDQSIFLGNDPVVWLQERLFSPNRVTALDFFAVQVHWSFFIAPHLAAVIIFVWRRELFPRYASVVVGTMYLGLALFFLLPTTPPWLAAQTGNLPQVFRVMDFVGGRVDGSTYRTFYESLGEPNSVAAMPSIHMGVTFAMYLWARTHYPRVAPWLLAYSLVMGAALIYLAEHYLFDLLVGMLCAAVVWMATRRWVPAPARVAEAASLDRS
jgi:membrane-associated phospholipid phosphatase